MVTSQSAASAFRKLRSIWFNAHLKRHGHERDRAHEQEDDEQDREDNNAERLNTFNYQTEAILNGDDRFVLAPACLQ